MEVLEYLVNILGTTEEKYFTIVIDRSEMELLSPAQSSDLQKRIVPFFPVTSSYKWATSLKIKKTATEKINVGQTSLKLKNAYSFLVDTYETM